ncbi:MAG: hypothetical protein ACOCYT_03430 [Chloroflexota bacterium]
MIFKAYKDNPLSEQTDLKQQLVSFWLHWWPAGFAALVLLVVTADVILRSMALNDGLFVYALDDAYIHMSIARHLVQDGQWAVSDAGFASASSSPLWTVMVAFSYVPFGVNAWTPLAMNILLGVGVLFAVHDVLRRVAVPGLYSLLVQLALIVLLPLNTLILIGMEHVLQILVDVLFLGVAARIICAEDAPGLRSGRWYSLLILGALVGSARYEGLFLVLIACVLLAARWRILHALTLGLVSIAPVGLFGLVAIANGWPFLPTSLLVKSDAGYLAQASFEALLIYFFRDTFEIFANQHVLSLLVLAALGAYIYRYVQVRAVAAGDKPLTDPWRALWQPPMVMLLLFVMIAFINVRLVSWPVAGTYARYEAYLIALGLVALAAALGADLPRRFALRVLPVYAVGMLLLLFVMQDVYGRYRFLAYQNPVVTGTTNIYRQQYQMGRFLRAYYQGEAVAANDIGAINYLADIHTVDLWGLGTLAVADARGDNRYSTATIREVTRAQDAEIAVVYDNWYDAFGGLPPEWVLVGQWQVRDSVILGSATVSFFAVEAEAAASLAANLRDFAPMLPESVIQSGSYLEGRSS